MLAPSEERPEEPPEELRLGDIEEDVVRSGLTWFNSFFFQWRLGPLDHPIENWSGEHIPSVQSTELLRHQLLFVFFAEASILSLVDFGGTRFGKC